eukprot:gene25236-10882_t
MKRRGVMVDDEDEENDKTHRTVAIASRICKNANEQQWRKRLDAMRTRQRIILGRGSFLFAILRNVGWHMSGCPGLSFGCF